MLHELEDLFKNEGQNIKIYFAKERVVDPNYNTKERTTTGSIVIRGLVSDLSYSKAIWRMPGIKAEVTKELIAQYKYKSYFEKSEKIEIDGEVFYGYKPANGNKIQIKRMGNYISILIHTNEVV
ncbi:MAG: hypothetical protein DRJ38_05460 [Thermoprotei archaeon]|nr:MAG: hypothetical protein DRJ38_05460 [Thermoprotei archaeon]